jgi:hypothetical protein
MFSSHTATSVDEPLFARSGFLQEELPVRETGVAGLAAYKFVEGLWWLEGGGTVKNSISLHAVQPGYKDIGLYDTSSIASDILWYQLFPHC